MHPLRNPRRIVLSVLLFALLSGGGLVGVAMATEEGEPTPLPFTFATPSQGDRGVYEVTSDADAWEFGRIERGNGQITFEHRGRSIVADGTGQPRVVDEIAYNDDRYDPDDYWGAPGRTAALIDVQTNQVIADIDEWNQEDEEDEEDVGLARVVRFLEEDHFYRDDLPCGLLNFLQGQTVFAGARVPGHDCNGHRLPQSATAHFVVDEVGADANASLVSLWQVRDNRAERIAALQFAAGIPYPVEVVLFDREETIGQLRLIGFDAGDEPLPPLTSFAMPAPASIVFAPRTPWMFDETGIEHPFPMSEAVRYARDDATQDLNSWLQARPDAYIVDASYWDYEDTTDRIEWRLTFRSDQDLYHLHIGKRFPVEEEQAPDMVQDLLDSTQESPSNYYYFTASTRDVDDYGAWHPAPAMLPTVASMWALYERMARPEMEPNMWELTILGGDEGNRVIVEAGRFRDFTSGRDEGSTYSRDWSFIDVNVQDGSVESFSDRGYDRPALQTSVSGDFSPQSYSSVETPGFAPFTAKQAASVGGGAALLALLYYLFPAGKGFAVGLFSRVRKDDALDHPTRQQIVDYLAAHPGCHHQELLRGLQLARGTGQHHLGKLEQTGHVVSVMSGGFKCYFLRGQQDRHTMRAHGAVKSPVAQGIVARLQAGPTSTGVLSKELGVRPATISYHLKRLREAGLVDHGPSGHMATAAAAAL